MIKPAIKARVTLMDPHQRRPPGRHRAVRAEPTSFSAATCSSTSHRPPSGRWSSSLRPYMSIAWFSLHRRGRIAAARDAALRPAGHRRSVRVREIMTTRSSGSATATTQIVRVLVVDDSAYVRKMVTQMLSRSPFIEVVGTARDGREALELATELSPDVITCDLNMPEMDGVRFVQEQMARRAIPIVIMSIANRAGEARAGGAGCRGDRLRAEADGAGQRAPARRRRRADRKGQGRRARRGALRGAGARAAAAGGRALRTASPRWTSSSSAFRPAGRRGSRSSSRGCPPTARCRWPSCCTCRSGYTEMYARKLDELSRAVGDGGEGGRRVDRRPGAAGARRAALDVPARRRPVIGSPRPAAARHAAPARRRRAVPVGRRGLRRADAGRRHDRAWGGRARRRGVDQGQGRPYPDRGGGSCVVYGMPRSVVEAGLSRQQRRHRRDGGGYSGATMKAKDPHRRRLRPGAAPRAQRSSRPPATRCPRRKTGCPRSRVISSPSPTWCCSIW